MDKLLGSCLGLISGKSWRALRDVVEPPFGHKAMGSLTREIERQVGEHIRKLSTTGRPAHGRLHPTEDLKMLPFWILCRAIYGPLPLHLVEQIEAMIPLREAAFRRVISGGIHRFCFFRFVSTHARDQLVRLQKDWRAFNQSALEYARIHAEKAPIIAMWDAVAEGKVSEVQVLQTLDEMLFANLDVTIGGLSWNFVFLAASPADQSRLRAEILSVNKEGCLEQYVQSSHSHLGRCVLESSRLRPLAAFSVPQSSRSTVVLDGFVIPEGTDFIVDTHALNIRGKLWSPDNLEFRPERFSQLKPTDLRYAFWRFGFGPRQCLGRHIADLIIRHTVVQIVQRFELAILDDKAWERDKAMWISCPDFELSCRGLDAGDSEERDDPLAICDPHRAVCPGQV